MQTQSISIEEYEKLDPAITVSMDGKEAHFSIPNSFTLWRVKSLRQKEPDTVDWIEGFKPNEILIDIGANVGMYSIWAAAMRDVQVFAFEPESQNYALLNKNIYINQLDKKVRAFCVALSDEEGFSDLHLSIFATGGSCHTFGEALDFKLESFTPPYRQGCYATTLDTLIANGTIPMPDHIKIDVDGIEHRVVKGCENALRNPKLQSILVEMNTNLAEHRTLIDHIKSLGFGVSEAQLAIAMRTEGPFKGVANHIFRRDLA